MGIRVTQRREFKGEDIVAVGESQGLNVWDGFLEHRLSADRHRFVEDFEASDHYRRHVGIVPDVFREERIEPIAAAKEHLPISALITTITELIALQAVGHVVVSKRLQLSGSNRDMPFWVLSQSLPDSIFQNAANAAARQALAFRVAGERSVLPVVPVQSVKRSHPQCSSPVFVDGGDAAAVESVRVTRVGHVIHKSFVLSSKRISAPPHVPNHSVPERS